jgi:hypothetical protein
MIKAHPTQKHKLRSILNATKARLGQKIAAITSTHSRHQAAAGCEQPTLPWRQPVVSYKITPCKRHPPSSNSPHSTTRRYNLGACFDTSNNNYPCS